jgi:hypothetical protein
MEKFLLFSSKGVELDGSNPENVDLENVWNLRIEDLRKLISKC